MSRQGFLQGDRKDCPLGKEEQNKKGGQYSVVKQLTLTQVSVLECHGEQNPKNGCLGWLFGSRMSNE